ncbi:Helicase associated domain protein [Paenibacillus silvae]|uniref:Helicase n=1 Tax=Paenibacillus silvae TaxID=1325358 RepID=A0A2W6NNL9_9BACL|nr:Helicase associated domain protein [Paenibacillus silvae]PZT57452.1 hypothetical protein DN757_02005 [Paenibacillus silvae]
MNIDLYPHNQETYEKIIVAWETQNRVATVQATGTGKSMLILKCLFTYPEGKKLVLAPSNHILDQLAGKVDELPNTILMTYAKLALMKQREIEQLNVNIIVLDEFHRCGAESWGDGVGKLIDTYADAKVLGTTATPIRYLDGERDMADELFDGNVVTNLSLPQAIVKGILPMPKYVSALYTFEDEILNLNEKINKSSNSDEEKDNMRKEVEQMKKKLDKSKGIPVILKKHLGKASGKFIVFCRNKEHLFEVKNTVAEWFIKGKVNSKITSYEVYTGSDEKDDAVIEQFRNIKVDNSIHLLFSINKLNEGLHVDDIDGVIFLRSTVSPIIYYQQLGRALKVGGNKPFVFDFVNNFNGIKNNKFAQELNEAFESENVGKASNNQEQLNIEDFTIYDEMQDVMELFGEIEERLADKWDEMFEKLKSTKVEVREGKILNWINTQRQVYKNGNMVLERIKKLESINFKWDIFDEKWDSGFVKFVEKGDVSLSNDKFLYNWINGQRKAYFKGLLSNDKIEKLNSVNFIWDKLEHNWSKTYGLLVDYYKLNGHSNMPKSYFVEGVDISQWVKNQRRNIKKGLLTTEKINKLKEVGVKIDHFGSLWSRAYEMLCQYYNENNHSNVPHDYKREGFSLGAWVNRQRINYKNGNISSKQVDKLQNVDFVFEALADEKWQSIYQILIEYKRINDNCNVPALAVFCNIKLGKWVGYQRDSYKKGKMTQERIDKLNAIGFQWEVHKRIQLQAI